MNYRQPPGRGRRRAGVAYTCGMKDAPHAVVAAALAAAPRAGRTIAAVLMLLAAFGATGIGGTDAGAATVSLELVTEPGVQITAPQEWLQRLADAGVTNVRVRGAEPGDRPAAEQLAPPPRAVYRVTAVLTRNDRVVAPGATFGPRDLAALRDYLERVRADGPEAATAERGAFGLTKPQFEGLFTALTPPLGMKTLGAPLQRVIQHACDRSGVGVDVGPGAEGPLDRAAPCASELGGLSTGTALAIALREAGLEASPRREPGGPTLLVLAPLAGGRDAWPAGHPSRRRPFDLAPKLATAIPVEVKGYSLADAVAAVEPRLGVPLIWDHHALRSAGVDPAGVQVSLAKTRTYYLRILEKLLFQARLKPDLRTDESGAPFLWVTR